MISSDRFNAQFDRFLKYIYKTSGDSNFRSFSSNETTEEQEGYKYKIYDLARENLEFRGWTEDMIGSGEIHEKSVESIRVEGGNNLVDWRLVDRYASGELIKTDKHQLEQLLYDLYKDVKDEGEIFADLREVLGSNYSLLAYLYFIKDRRRFLPISTTRFDKAFELLGVDYKSSYQCDWENYTQYNLLIEEVKFLLMEKGVADVSLLDAHSFLWIISKDLEKEVSDFDEEIEIKLWKAPEISEVKREVLQRKGQDIFRKRLIQYWKGKCSVTGIDYSGVLIASHIKPWKESTDDEKFDLYNGLLLVSTIDSLFDRGLITFDDDGLIILSEELNPEEYDKLGINKELKLSKVEDSHKEFLEYHRDNIFKGVNI